MLKPAFNAQRLRVIIVFVQVGAMGIYVAAAEALRKMFLIGGKTSLGPHYFVL